MKQRLYCLWTLLFLLAFNPAIAANNKAMALFAEGFDFVRDGKLKEATAKFGKGLKLDPGNAMAHYYIAESYRGLNIKDKSKKHYQLAIKLDPAGDAGKNARNGLARLEFKPPSDPYAVGSTFQDCPECPAMVVVPAGQFIMGSPPSEADRYENEGPPHMVKFERPFAVGKYEVTFREWCAYDQDATCGDIINDPKKSRFPASPITYYQAVNWYISWLNKKTNKVYRLLTEAEWEYAARAGTRTSNPWGNSIARKYANYGKDICCGGGVGGDDEWMQSAPVGSFPPNAFGLYDMLGNVSEWVQDCFSFNYDSAPNNGAAWVNPNPDKCPNGRVVRGGSWTDSPVTIRSAKRVGMSEEYKFNFIGFRVARDLP